MAASVSQPVSSQQTSPIYSAIQHSTTVAVASPTQALAQGSDDSDYGSPVHFTVEEMEEIDKVLALQEQVSFFRTTLKNISN